VTHRRAADGALSAAVLSALGAASGPKLPVLALAQARMLSDVRLASGADSGGDQKAAAQELAVPLALSLGTGLAARELVRRLPRRARVLDAAVAAGVTFALAAVFRRLPRL